MTRNLLSPDIQFWLFFGMLNAALFLPAFLLNADATVFWPSTEADNLGSFLFRLFIWRENLDIFRLNIEFTWMVAVTLVLAQLRRPVLYHLFLALYLFMFVYYAYESAMLYLYRTDPQFFSDYYLIRDGLGFLLENVGLSTGSLLSGLALLIGIFALLITGFRRALRHISTNHLHRYSQLTLVGFAVASLITVVTYQTTLANPMMVTSSAFFKLAQNISDSVTSYHILAQFQDVEISDAYEAQTFELAAKPDIYLIFIESYGSVLYKRPDYHAEYAQLAATMRRELRQNGWHVASALSDAPTWGGGSWLAYTSALFGLRIENHPQYLTLMEKYGLGDERYPHLGSYLQSQGYQFVWLSALAEQLSERQWRRYNNFYSYDRLVRYPDLEYMGPHYGWGPSPPDQYSLGYTHANVIEPFNGPSFLFFITQNSHFPWAPIPPVLDDWRAFQTRADEDEPEPVDLIEHAALRARYMESIVYSWEMLLEFILHQGSEDAIYIIAGDHQPPRVSRRSDGLDTPVHVISRDADFTGTLTQYGFQRDTIYVRDSTPTLRHEGLFTLIVRHLNEHYGTDTTRLPTYHAEGFPLDNYIEYVEEEETAGEPAAGPTTAPAATPHTTSALEAVSGQAPVPASSPVPVPTIRP